MSSKNSPLLPNKDMFKSPSIWSKSDPLLPNKDVFNMKSPRIWSENPIKDKRKKKEKEARKKKDKENIRIASPSSKSAIIRAILKKKCREQLNDVYRKDLENKRRHKFLNKIEKKIL